MGSIAAVVADTLAGCDGAEATVAEDVFEADRRARERAERSVRTREGAA